MHDDPYSRTRRLLGQNALDALRAARVAVFGIGGVGGHAAEGPGPQRRGRADRWWTATPSPPPTLNRQLVALRSTLGQYKVDAMAARIADIDPAIRVTPLRLFYGPDTADAVDLAQFDYVLDCNRHRYPPSCC